MQVCKQFHKNVQTWLPALMIKRNYSNNIVHNPGDNFWDKPKLSLFEAESNVYLSYSGRIFCYIYCLLAQDYAITILLKIKRRKIIKYNIKAASDIDAVVGKAVRLKKIDSWTKHAEFYVRIYFINILIIIIIKLIFKLL